MGLASALTTALTGLSAAETQIDVIGNNLANSQTVGFKASDAVFSTQFLQTLSLGGAPTADNGGTNPRQIGLGVQVADIAPDFTQGTIEISSSPSHLAIQGDGFFMVEGAQKEKLYTRNGTFSLNSENQLVTATGHRLLGFGVDDLFRIEPTELEAIEIPLGSAMVAKSTENVTLEGTLTPEGDVATAAQVIESAILGDSNIPVPDASGSTATTTPVTRTNTLTPTAGGGGALDAGTYQYRIAYATESGYEAVPSDPVTVTTGAGGRVDLGTLPAAPSDEFTAVNVYRTDADGDEFFLLDSVAPDTGFVDDGSSALSLSELDGTNLTGNYSYMITYHKDGEVESRPSEIIGPQSIVNNRVTLDGFPLPPDASGDGSTPEYDEIRVYRNLASDQNNFYLVDTVDPGDTFIDNKTDAEISDLSVGENKRLDLDGPKINSNTRLVDVIKREGNTYQNLFEEGTLSYQGRKGGRALGAKDLTVTETTTVQQLIDFVEEASGIQVANSDSQNPIPESENKIPGETGDLLPGGYIQDGRIRFVSNNGDLNALSIDLTAFRQRDNSGSVVATPNLAFGTVQEGAGTSASSDFIVYDTLGVPVNVRVTATLESRTSEETVYRWYADSPDNQPLNGSSISVGSGLVRFDGNGNFIAATETRVNVNRVDVPSATPLQFDLDFSGVSGLATSEASLAATRQDGSAPGVLTDFVIGEEGLVRGVFSNGVTRNLGQVQLARFANPAGLDERGQNLWAQGINTGLPVQGGPGENGIGAIKAGALELSNTDIGKDLVDLVLAGTMYRGNTRVINSSQQLLDELLNLRR